jgi:hypothetical protein
MLLDAFVAMAPARTVARSTAVMIRRGILGPQRSAILVVGGEEGIEIDDDSFYMQEAQLCSLCSL